MLFIALEFANQASRFFERSQEYSASDEKVVQNSYAEALACFQVAYLREKYSQTLEDEVVINYAKKYIGEELISKFINREDRTPLVLFKRAYNRFKDCNHLKGQYLSKLHEYVIMKNLETTTT